jgi:hypothetical protein
MQTPFCVRCLVFTPSSIFSSIITSNIRSNFLHALFDNHSEVSEALTWYYMVLHAKYSKSSSTYLIYLYMLYIALHSCMMLYDAVCEYMWMMWDDASLWVYTCLHWQHLTAMRGIHGYIWLYTAIYGYIRLYKAIFGWTALNSTPARRGCHEVELLVSWQFPDCQGSCLTTCVFSFCGKKWK